MCGRWRNGGRLLEAEGLDVVDCVALEVPDNAGSLLRTRADVPAG